MPKKTVPLAPPIERGLASLVQSVHTCYTHSAIYTKLVIVVMTYTCFDSRGSYYWLLEHRQVVVTARCQKERVKETTFNSSHLEIDCCLPETHRPELGAPYSR